MCRQSHWNTFHTSDRTRWPKCLFYPGIKNFWAESGAASVMVARAAEWNTSVFRSAILLPELYWEYIFFHSLLQYFGLKSSRPSFSENYSSPFGKNGQYWLYMCPFPLFPFIPHPPKPAYLLLSIFLYLPFYDILSFPVGWGGGKVSHCQWGKRGKIK